MKSEHARQLVLERLRSDGTLRQHLERLGSTELLEALAVQLQAVAPGPGLISSDAALQAALCLTFSRDDIDAPTEQIEALLVQSRVQDANGLSRLKLDDGFRAEVLDNAQRRGVLQAALQLTHDKDRTQLAAKALDTLQLESAWLRQLLRNEPLDLDRYAPVQLQAICRARLALCECQHLRWQQPGLVKIQRQLQWLELIEPLRLMIGAPQRSPRISLQRDRFAGRVKELRQLRSFVDELASESTGELISRTFSKVQRHFSDRARLLMVSAQGGLGKSTLISKFAYDHAVSSRKMPFAYLDFDSAMLQPRVPLLLLAEVARQVALFYPDAFGIDEFIDNLREEVLLKSREAAAAEPESSKNRRRPKEDYFYWFRGWLEQILTINAAQTFLLVLDTVELVQSDPLAIEGLQQFLRELVHLDFPKLAVVVSGRAEVPELWEGIEHKWRVSKLQLEPLSVDDARRMVQLLGESLLEAQWQPQWSRKMISQSRNDASREPLSLRIAVETICQTDAALREQLVADIGRMGEDCGASQVDFVGRLYQKRILEHIDDPFARRLAWPGLVACRLSKALARDVLAGECGLTSEQAQNAYERLKRHVWIVTEEGGELRHRADLRARTLPLMRRHDEVLFKRICGLLNAYYLGKRPSTLQSQAEATYYQLLGDDREATQLLDHDEGGVLQQLLLQRQDDFAEQSLVTLELRVRQAITPLQDVEFLALPVALAWRHLDGAGQALKAMVDRRIDPRVLHLSRSIDVSPRRRLSAAQQTILIKTGRWKELLRRDFVEPVDTLDLHAAAFMANFLFAVSWMEEPWLHGFSRFLKSAEIADMAWTELVYLLLPAASISRELYHRVDAQLAKTDLRKRATVTTWLPMLRVGLAFGTQSLEMLFRALHRLRDVAKPINAVVSRAEFEILRSSRSLGGHRLESVDLPHFGMTNTSVNQDIYKAVFDILEEAGLRIASGGDWAVAARQDIRRFALAGEAGLSSPAGYLLAQSNGTLRGLRKRWNSSGRSNDLVQKCRFAEEQQQLALLLEDAQREAKEEVFLDNLELLEILCANWSAGLNEHFMDERIP
ncbi:hypothetical protein [Pseudomonas putida]|uniref:Uncharacterized protein n=1 Tax=Pseudomonas putida TaxID=303 RepID=A0A8I1ECC2_PSEPU|nr:hypothetical protein [Pseudomonas putida]MBI6883437.1 hypothetical protein [Pseudomonas putida]